MMRISLKAKLIVMMVALVVLANVLIGTVAIKVSTSAMDETIHQNLMTVSEKVSNEIRDMNEKEFNLIRGLANLPFIREGSMELSEICAQLNKVVNADATRYENIGYYNAAGFSYSAAGVYHSSKDKDYFQAAIAGKEFICDPFFSTVGNKVLQIYSVSVYGYDNRINGVITAILYGDRLTDLIKQMDIGGGFHPAVIDRRNGTTIANANEGTDVEGNNVTDLDPTSELAVTLGRVVSGETGSVNFYDHNLKMKMSSSFTPVEKTEWSVFCVAPYNYFYGKLDILRMFILISLGVTVAIALIIGLILISIFIKPLRTLKTAILDIASGNADLTKRLPKASKDEIGDVVNGFNQFVGKLQEIMQDIKLSNGTLESAGVDLNASTEDTSASISEIITNIETIHSQINDQNDSVSETAGAVNEIASNIESLDRMIDSQSRGVSQASTAVEEMIGNINSVTNSMDKMADSFEKLSTSAQTGASLQSNAAERIERIKSQSETLQEANRAIAAIAEQTNLLAMNAAIEAAHAGEAGKGFSVVADEIRKLSETSGEQSRTIGEQLTSIESLIDEMVTASQKSSEAFLDVTSRISDTDELVHQIKAAMEEQAIGSQQITDALHSMNDSTIEVKNASKEMSEGNKAILESVRSLQDSSTQMKSSMEVMSASARKIDETGNALTGISEKMKESITEIGSEINQFKI